MRNVSGKVFASHTRTFSIWFVCLFLFCVCVWGGGVWWVCVYFLPFLWQFFKSAGKSASPKSLSDLRSDYRFGLAGSYYSRVFPYTVKRTIYSKRHVAISGWCQTN